MACLFLLLACAGALHLPAQALKPGFDKAKYLELLRPHARMGGLAKPIDGARPAAERRRSLLWPAAQGWGLGGRQARQQKRRQRQQAGYSSKHEWAGKREQGRRVAAISLTRRTNYPKSPLWPDILVVLKKTRSVFHQLVPTNAAIRKPWAGTRAGNLGLFQLFYRAGYLRYYRHSPLLTNVLQ